MTVGRSDLDDYTRFLRGELSAQENQKVVRGLLAPRQVRHSEIAGVVDGGLRLGELSSRLASRAQEIARERRCVSALLERLRGLPPGPRRALLLADPAFHNWWLGERLIEESRILLDCDPAGAGELAGDAIALAGRLSSETYGAPLIHDLKARAWAGAGEVCRRRADFRGAEEAFVRAESCIARGTADGLEEAQIIELRAVLARDQYRAEEAHRLLDEAIAVYRQYRDAHLMGRAFIQKGRVEGKMSSHLDSAIQWLRKGLGLLDPQRDRVLDLSARHSLMLYLNESGRPREARFLLKASKPEFLQHGSPLLKLRLRWLDGKIYLALGFPAEAEKALAEARQGFVEMEMDLIAAGVSLDLAGLYAAEGRGGEMRRLAEEILPIFQSRDLRREANAALIAFQQAARMETLNAQLLAEIRISLDQARQDPHLRFEPL
jgi:tetratricopeptide (TPR) repeat protein